MVCNFIQVSYTILALEFIEKNERNPRDQNAERGLSRSHGSERLVKLSLVDLDDLRAILPLIDLCRVRQMVVLVSAAYARDRVPFEQPVTTRQF